jgi:hypothetical protein
MKLRIHDDAIRFRLTRTETARLGDGFDVESSCRFPSGRTLTYALTLAARASIEVRFDGDRIEVALPRDRTVEWARSDAVTLPNDDGTPRAQVLVEKDFACVEPRSGEDPSDLFPNPKARPAS